MGPRRHFCYHSSRFTLDAAHKFQVPPLTALPYAQPYIQPTTWSDVLSSKPNDLPAYNCQRGDELLALGKPLLILSKHFFLKFFLRCTDTSSPYRV